VSVDTDWRFSSRYLTYKYEITFKTASTIKCPVCPDPKENFHNMKAMRAHFFEVHEDHIPSFIVTMGKGQKGRRSEGFQTLVMMRREYCQVGGGVQAIRNSLSIEVLAEIGEDLIAALTNL
jgi:hypothetical protein